MEWFFQRQCRPPILASDLPSGLNITQWNLRSITQRDGNTKLDELKLILLNTNKETHILEITETWLDNTFNNNSVSIKGYEMERVDRHEGDIPIDKDSGTMIYISDKKSYIGRDDLES